MALDTHTPTRRHAIESVASVLFHERGYAATSVRDIARALDIQGASLYAHVTSKEDVLWAIVDRAAAAFEDAADRAEAETTSRGPADRISALVQAHVRVVAADPRFASVFISEWRHLSPDRRSEILDRRDAYEARYRRIISDGIANGDFTSTDPALAATFILTALNGLATWYRPEGRLPASRIADHYADLALRTLTEDHR
jgi:AcrR family transcriptional regulator